MRLFRLGRARVAYGNMLIPCAVRPIKGQWEVMCHGAYPMDMLRLLLPWKMKIQPGERLEVEGKPYLCLSVRCYPGHVQADVRRCSR